MAPATAPTVKLHHRHNSKLDQGSRHVRPIFVCSRTCFILVVFVVVGWLTLVNNSRLLHVMLKAQQSTNLSKAMTTALQTLKVGNFFQETSHTLTTDDNADQVQYDSSNNTVLSLTPVVEQLARQELKRNAALVHDCDVCRILNILYQHDLKFAITGDSMMLQTFSGLWCELSRRGYRISENTTYHSFHPYFVGIRGFTILEITGPSHWTKPVHITFLSQYQPRHDMSEIRHIASTYDVVVINFGIHWVWRRRKQYQATMTDVFNATKYGKSLQLLAYRETSSQHFDGPAGEWEPTSKLFPCNPWQNESTASLLYRWREKSAQASAAKLGYKVIVSDESLPSVARAREEEKELVILPFYNFSRHLHDLHPGECTHFCSTPFLWMPIWRSLRLAMDRQWNMSMT